MLYSNRTAIVALVALFASACTGTRVDEDDTASRGDFTVYGSDNRVDLASSSVTAAQRAAASGVAA